MLQGAIAAGSDPASRDLVERYFVQLEHLESKFGNLFCEGAAEGVLLQWQDTFTDDDALDTSLVTERLAVAYNLGAIEANLGRGALGAQGAHNSSDQGLKTAVSHFQKAAGMFAMIIEMFEAGAQTSATDLAKEPMAALRNLMLAQAQECVLSKALGGDHNSPLLARIAAQVAELYDQALTGMLVAKSSGLVPKEGHPWEMWMVVSRIKSMHYRAYGQLLQATIDINENKFGEEVGRLTVAQQLCESVGKITKQTKGTTLGDAADLHALVEERLAKAVKLNREVYTARVVPEELLEAIQPQMLVRAQPLTTTLQIAEIFARLIPMEVYLAASTYTSERDELVRGIEAAVFTKDVELDKTLGSMGLADETHKDTQITLPATLFQKAALLRSSEDGTASLETKMQLCKKKHEAITVELRTLEGEFDACKSTLSTAVTTALKSEVSAVRGSLKQARTMDADLAETWDDLRPSLGLLAGPVDTLRAAMPGANPLDSPIAPQRPSQQLDSLLESIKSLRVQRLNMAGALKSQLVSSDITSELAAASDTAATIAFMMEQHRGACAPLNENLAKQAELLGALVETNAGMKETRQHVKKQKEAQTEFVDQLANAYVAFTAVRNNADQGLRYYEELAKNLSNFTVKLKRAKETAKVYARENAGQTRQGSIMVKSQPAGVGRGQGKRALYSNLSEGLGGLSVAEGPGDTSNGVRSAGGAASASTDAAADTFSMSPLEYAIDAFEREVSRMEQMNDYGQTGYYHAFESLRQEDLNSYDPRKFSVAQQHREQNRYRDILPADHSRVKLRPIESGGSDYINATCLKSLLPGSPDYIAAQGPKPNTVGDFWTMIKQQGVRVVVMVTNVIELGRTKCEQYWPSQGDTKNFPESPQGHALDVTCTVERNCGAWIERHFMVVEYHRNAPPTTRQVAQFHFTAWPDKDVPSRPNDLILFLHAVMAAQHRGARESKGAGEPKPPLLVHCSAGVGRTGTFAAIYSVLNSLPHMGRSTSKVPRSIDVIALVLTMRSNRRYMCQTMQQLEFTFRTILYAGKEFLASYKVRQNSRKQASGPSSPVDAAVPSTDGPATQRLQQAPVPVPAPAPVPQAVAITPQLVRMPGRPLTGPPATDTAHIRQDTREDMLRMLDAATAAPPNGTAPPPSTNPELAGLFGNVDAPACRASNPFKALPNAPSDQQQQQNQPVRRPSNPFLASALAPVPILQPTPEKKVQPMQAPMQPMQVSIMQPTVVTMQPGSSDQGKRRTSNPFLAMGSGTAAAVASTPFGHLLTMPELPAHGPAAAVAQVSHPPADTSTLLLDVPLQPAANPFAAMQAAPSQIQSHAVPLQPQHAAALSENRPETVWFPPDPGPDAGVAVQPHPPQMRDHAPAARDENRSTVWDLPPQHNPHPHSNAPYLPSSFEQKQRQPTDLLLDPAVIQAMQQQMMQQQQPQEQPQQHPMQHPMQPRAIEQPRQQQPQQPPFDQRAVVSQDLKQFAPQHDIQYAPNSANPFLQATAMQPIAPMQQKPSPVQPPVFYGQPDTYTQQQPYAPQGQYMPQQPRGDPSEQPSQQPPFPQYGGNPDPYGEYGSFVPQQQTQAYAAPLADAPGATNALNSGPSFFEAGIPNLPATQQYAQQHAQQYAPHQGQPFGQQQEQQQQQQQQEYGGATEYGYMAQPQPGSYGQQLPGSYGQQLPAPPQKTWGAAPLAAAPGASNPFNSGLSLLEAGNPNLPAPTLQPSGQRTLLD